MMPHCFFVATACDTDLVLVGELLPERVALDRRAAGFALVGEPQAAGAPLDPDWSYELSTWAAGRAASVPRSRLGDRAPLTDRPFSPAG